MNEETVAKYIASHDALVDSCENLFEGQQHYFSTGEVAGTFKPELFVASNTRELFKSKNSKIVFKKSKSNVPHEVYYVYNDVQYRILHNGTFGKQEAFVATSLYLEMSRDVEDKKTLMNFNYNGYYTSFNEYIDFRRVYVQCRPAVLDSLDIATETSLFYIEYGFWNHIFFSTINGLNYIASYPELMNTFRNDERQGLLHYFNHGMVEGKIITFRPEVYIISNFEKLKDLVVENDEPKLKEATSHYIMNGYYQDLPRDTFNQFDYLANNPKRIRYLLSTNDDITWDFNKLIKSTCAKDFLRNFANVKKRKFDAVDFVKRYVGDAKINFDRNLSLANASFYFVRGYVMHKSLRRTLTGWNRIKRFMNNRIEDGLKQIPFSITRFVIENKFL